MCPCLVFIISFHKTFPFSFTSRWSTRFWFTIENVIVCLTTLSRGDKGLNTQWITWSLERKGLFLFILFNKFTDQLSYAIVV